MDRKGELTKTLTLVSGEDGLHRLDMVRAESKAVLHTKYPNEKVIVFDLTSQSIAKSCLVPGGFAQWAGGSPLTYQISLTPAEFVGFDLSPGIDCERSIRSLTSAEYVFPTIEGSAASGSVASQEGFSFQIEKSGEVSNVVAGQRLFSRKRVPAGMVTKSPGSAGLLADTPELWGLVTDGRAIFLDKKLERWSAIETRGLIAQSVFGSYAVFAEYEERPKANEEEMPKAPTPAKASDSEWRAGRSDYGPDIRFEFFISRRRFPGVLHIANIRSGTRHVLRTDQADSQVLLIDGNVVYYRASDRLYRAQISGAGELKGKVIATSEAIRDAHWAFLAN